MSRSRGCLLVKWVDKKWYTIVAQREYDYDFEDFSIYGPYQTEEEAWDKFPESNPGGSQTIKCKRQKDLPETLKKALKKYIKNGYKMPPFVVEQVPYRHRDW